MANNASALKRIRKTQAQTQRNRAVKSRVKTHRKKVLAALAAGDKAGADRKSTGGELGSGTCFVSLHLLTAKLMKRLVNFSNRL